MLTMNTVAAVSNHLWQSTLFVLAAWGLCALLRRQQAKIRYAVWMAASVKFLVPFSLLIALGASMHRASRVMEAPPTVETGMQQVAQPFRVMDMEEAAVTARPGQPDGSRTNFPELLPMGLGFLWAIGFSGFALLWIREWLRLRRIADEALPIRCGGALPVRVSNAAIEPGVFCVFHPVVVIPAAVKERLTSEQMRALLLHEVQHARRRDNLTAALHMLVQLLFWFYPPVWWIKRRLVEERELACDEAVLQAEADPYIYAEGIIAVCKSSLEAPPLWVSGITGADLKRRIAHILEAPAVERLGWIRIGAMVVMAAATIAVPLASGMIEAHAASVFADSEEEQVAAIAAMPRLEFEVASVKLNKLGIPPYGPSPDSNVDLDPGEIYAPTHGVLSIRNKSLRTLIAFGWKMSGDQQNYLKHHVPEFVLNERFDVEARSENTNPTKDQMRAMMRSLLEERFHLRVHNETLQENIYAMVQTSPGKLGPSMRIHKADDPACESEESRKQSPMPLSDGFPAVCGVVVGMPAMGKGTETKYMMKIGGRNVPMSLVAAAMVAPYTGDTGLDRNVVDKTGMTENVDFTLELGFDEMEATFTPNTAPLFTRELNEQLGLKLKGQKGPINVYVVDQVEHLHED